MRKLIVMAAVLLWPREAIVGSYASLETTTELFRLYVDSGGTVSMRDPEDELEWIARWQEEHQEAFEITKLVLTRELRGAVKPFSLACKDVLQVPIGDRKATVTYCGPLRAETRAEILERLARALPARDAMDVRFASVSVTSGPLCTTLTKYFWDGDGKAWKDAAQPFANAIHERMVKALAELKLPTTTCTDALLESDDVERSSVPFRHGVAVRDPILFDRAVLYVYVGFAARPTKEQRVELVRRLNYAAGGLHGLYDSDDDDQRDRPWSATDYTGEYSRVRFLPGSTERTQLTLRLTKTGGELVVGGTKLPLAYVSITNGLLWLELPADARAKEPLPALRGRFVQRFPPANAKGEVINGVRLGRELFRRLR